MRAAQALRNLQDLMLLVSEDVTHAPNISQSSEQPELLLPSAVESALSLCSSPSPRLWGDAVPVLHKNNVD